MNDTEIVNYIYDNYEFIKKRFSKEQVEKFWLLYKDKSIIVYNDNKIEGIGIYLKLTDETFNSVKSRELSLDNPDNLNFCMIQNGYNIHFIMVIADNLKIITLNRLRQISEMENIKTVSWFSPDMKKIFIRKRKEILCQW